MCRLLGWNGRPTSAAWPVLDAPHSLRRQSHSSREAPVRRHGDGNGLAWYRRGGRPGRTRSAASGWGDARLAAVARTLVAPLALAHVRAATEGGARRVNSHPFVDGRIAFVHVGAVAGMDELRPGLLDVLSPGRRANMLGDTDSELLFALLMEHDLEREPAAAYEAVLSLLAERQDAAGTERSVRLAALHADGRSLFVRRHATDGAPPLLYRSNHFVPGVTTIASEPLDDRRRGWTLVPAGKSWRVGPRGLGGA